jgi:hypothetical protein
MILLQLLLIDAAYRATRFSIFSAGLPWGTAAGAWHRYPDCDREYPAAQRRENWCKADLFGQSFVLVFSRHGGQHADGTVFDAVYRD